MVFGTTFSSQNLISETNKGKLILKIDEGFYQFIKDPSNYGEINIDGSQNIKIYPGLGITDICAIDLFIANRSSNMFSNNSHNCLQRDLSDIDFISYTCLSENTIYDISLDNSFVEITIEYKANKLNKLNEIKTNDISVNRNSSKLKFFNSPKIFNNALKNDYSKYLITPELNDEYNIPGRDLSGHFNNLIYYKSSNYEGDISTSLYIDDTSAEILTPVQLLNYKLLEIQEEAMKEDPNKNVFFYTKNWGNYTHPLSGFHLGALAYNNLLYNDLSYDSNVFYNENSGNYYDEQTYRKLTIPHMANKYVKRINDISLSIVNWYSDINLQTESTSDFNYPDLSLIYNSDFNKLEQGTSVKYKDKNLLFNTNNEWQYICDVCFTDISLYSETYTDLSDISYIYHEIKDNFFNIFNEDRIGQPSKLINCDDSDFSCIKTKLGLPEDSIGRDCEIKMEYCYVKDDDLIDFKSYQRKVNYYFKGYDLSSCFGFFNSEYNSEMFGQHEISGTSYDISYLYNTGGDILSEPGLMECATSLAIDICNQIHNSDNYDLCGGKMNYKKKYGYTVSNFNNKDLRLGDNSWEKVLLNTNSINGMWSFYTNNTRVTPAANELNHTDTCILWNKVIDTYKEEKPVSDLKIKDVLHSSYKKYLKFMDKNFFSFNEWANLENDNATLTQAQEFHYKKADITLHMDISNVSIDNIFENKAFITLKLDKSLDHDDVSAQTLYDYDSDEFQYYNIDKYINEISKKGTNQFPIFSSPLYISKYISGSITDFFRYIEFVNRRGKKNDFDSDGYEEFRIVSNKVTNMNSFPFLILGYNYNTSTKTYQINVTTENTNIIERHRKANYIPKLKVYARKARQDINTKNLLDIKEFDKIPLFLYKDPFVNNHHQFEITSETIPTIYPALTCDVSSIYGIDNSNRLYNKKSLEEIYLSVDFTNSTNNLNNIFLSNFKTQLNKNNELLYFAQQNKNNPPIKFKIRNSNYDDFSYNFGTDNSYSIVNGQYSTIINDLISFNLPRFQYRPIYETINTNILSILNCNNNPDFSTNFGNKHFENLLAINNNKLLPTLNEEKYTYKLIDYSDNSIYNLNKIYKYDAIDLSSYSYFADISLNDNSKINILHAFNDICTNYYDMSLINYMNNKNSRKIDNFPLYQNINIKIDRTDYTTSITDGSNYKLDLQLWDVSNMFIDISNKYQIDFSNINCKGSNIFSLIEDISINNDWDYIYSEKLLRSRDFSFSTSVPIDLSFSINITELSDSNMSMINNNFLDFSYNLYDTSLNSTISNDSIENRFILNFNYLTSRDNSENFNYYLNNVKNLNIIDNTDRNLLENYNNDNLNNFNMKMFDFETLHPKINSTIINDNSKIDICPEAFLNCDLFFENNFNLYDSSYNYYKINNTKDPNYLDISNSRLNISELFEYKMFSSNNLIQDITKSIETFNFTPFTKKFINDISFYFSDNISYIYSNKYSPLNINVKNDLIPNVNLIDNNKLVYKNTILLPKDASNLFADLNFDKINSLMNFTKTDNCDKMFKNTLSLYDNRLLKFSAFNNFNNDISLNEMFMNSSINHFPYLLINSLKNISNTIKIEAKDIITNCNNMYLNEYFLAIRSFSEVLDFDNNLKYTDTNFTNVEISWNLTNNKYFGGAYPLDFEKSIIDVNITLDNSLQLIVSLDSEKGIYWDYYINSSNIFNCTNKLDSNKIPTNQNYWPRLHRRGNSYEDLCLNIYRCKEQSEFFKLGYDFLRGLAEGIAPALYWSIGFLLKILGFTDLSNQTHYNKPISLNSKYEQRRKFLKEKMYKHNNSDQILDWYGVDDICCGQPLTNRDSYRTEQTNLNFYQQLNPEDIVLTMRHHNPPDEITPVSNYFTANTFFKNIILQYKSEPTLVTNPPNGDFWASREIKANMRYYNVSNVSKIKIYNAVRHTSYFLNLYLDDILDNGTSYTRKITISSSSNTGPTYVDLIEDEDNTNTNYVYRIIDGLQISSDSFMYEDANATHPSGVTLGNRNGSDYLIVDICYANAKPLVNIKYFITVPLGSAHNFTDTVFNELAVNDYNNLLVTGVSKEQIKYDFSFEIPIKTQNGQDKNISSSNITSFEIYEHGRGDWWKINKKHISLKAFKDINYKKYSIDDYSLNQVNLFNLFPETSYCWLDLSVNLSYHDIYNKNNYIDKTVKPNMNLNIMKNEPFYRTDTLYDFPSKIHYANEYLNLSWLERFAINQLNTGYKFNDSPVFRYIYVNSFSTPILRAHKYTQPTIIKTQISDIMINVKVNNSDQSFVLIDNSICELFNLSFGNMFYDISYEKPWFNDGSGIYTSIGNDRLTNISLKGYTSKKFPFYHITSKNISDSVNSNNLKDACLDRLKETGIDRNYNFWLKIDLGFILNKLYPNDFTSQSIPLDRINYIYFYENPVSDNLTYILSNINYSSRLEQKEIHFSYKNNLLQPGFLSAGPVNSFSMYSPQNSYYINNTQSYYNDGNYNDGINYEVEAIWNRSDTMLYNYKVFNCNELNLFTYTNGFEKDFNQSLGSSSEFKTVINFNYFKTKVKVNSIGVSLIPDTNVNGKNGILIKGNTDFNNVKIFTEISNNIASFINFKNSDITLSNLQDVSDNTIIFDYTPYQNRSDYETREIKNYFIENYYNLIEKSLEPELHQDGINATNSLTFA